MGARAFHSRKETADVDTTRIDRCTPRSFSSNKKKGGFGGVLPSLSHGASERPITGQRSSAKWARGLFDRGITI